MSNSQPYNPAGIAFSLCCAAFVGMHMVISKTVLDDVDPIVAVCLMTFASSLFSTIPLISRKRKGFDPFAVPRTSYGYCALHCLLASGGMAFTWTGLAQLNPTITSFVGRTEVVVSVICAFLFLGERLTAIKLFGIALGAAGVLVLSSAGIHSSDSTIYAASTRSIIYVLLGAMCFGSCEVFAVKCVAHIPVSYFIFFRSVLNRSFIGLLAILSHRNFNFQFEHFAVLALAAFFGPYFGRILFMASLERIPLSVSIGLNQTQPLFAALLGSFFMMELPNAQQWFGGLMILSGCLFLVGIKGRWRKLTVRKERNAS